MDGRMDGRIDGSITRLYTSYNPSTAADRQDVKKCTLVHFFWSYLATVSDRPPREFLKTYPSTQAPVKGTSTPRGVDVLVNFTRYYPSTFFGPPGLMWVLPEYNWSTLKLYNPWPILIPLWPCMIPQATKTYHWSIAMFRVYNLHCQESIISKAQ